MRLVKRALAVLIGIALVSCIVTPVVCASAAVSPWGIGHGLNRLNPQPDPPASWRHGLNRLNPQPDPPAPVGNGLNWLTPKPEPPAPWHRDLIRLDPQSLPPLEPLWGENGDFLIPSVDTADSDMTLTWGLFTDPLAADGWEAFLPGI